MPGRALAGVTTIQIMYKRIVLLLGLLVAAPPGMAAGDGPSPGATRQSDDIPTVSIIIDDLGEDLHAGRRAINLPGPLAYSLLPHTTYVRDLAKAAHRRNKEVLLHLPMQTVDGRDVGRGGLTLDMTEHELARMLREDIASVPHVVGINNHMGSLLTRHPGHMLWLMREINRHGDLFFVDSRTTVTTVAQQVANENGVPNLRRDVFLDHDPDPDFIARQFRQLLHVARRQGWALGIGHPYATTLDFLEQHLPRLGEYGVRLVPVSSLINKQHTNDQAPHLITHRPSR